MAFLKTIKSVSTDRSGFQTHHLHQMIWNVDALDLKSDFQLNSEQFSLSAHTFAATGS